MDIQRLDFYQDQISTCKDEDTGHAYCLPRELSERLGVSWGGQSQKLKGKLYQRHTRCLDIQTPGGKQEMVLLDVEMLPAWLLSISAEKVKPAIQEKLLRYQEECAQALRDYWTKGFAHNPRSTLSAQDIVRALAENQVRLETRVENLETTVASRLEKVESQEEATRKELNALKDETIQRLTDENAALTTKMTQLIPPIGWKTAFEWLLSDLYGDEAKAFAVILRRPPHIHKKDELSFFEYLAICRMQAQGMIPSRYAHQFGYFLYMPYEIFRSAVQEYIRLYTSGTRDTLYRTGNQKIRPIHS